VYVTVPAAVDVAPVNVAESVTDWPATIVAGIGGKSVVEIVGVALLTVRVSELHTLVAALSFWSPP
jgi:hypothetical protein